MMDKNLVSVGIKSKDIDAQNVEVEYLGKKQIASHFVPYGVQIKPPDGNLCLKFQQDGNEDSLIVIVTDLTNRDTDLEDGEIFLGIPTLTTRIKFREDGKLEIFSENEIILETEGGNKIETSSTGILIEDLNGNTQEGSAIGWNFNSGNAEVLQ